MRLTRFACRLSIFLTAQFLFSLPANAKWFRAESPHFIVYGGSEAELRKDVQRLENFDKLLRTMANIPPAKGAAKLSVYMVRDIDLVNDLYSTKPNSVAGFYSANEAGVLAVVPREAYDNFDDAVLFHEYAHHLMLKYFPTAYPAWYVEGFAEFLSTVTFEKGVAKVGMPANHRGYELYGLDPVPIDRLLNTSVGDLKGSEIGSFYARSWLLVHYLTFVPGREGSQRKYLNLINNGTAPADAATQAFGDVKRLNHDLNNYMKANRFSAVSYKMENAAVSITVTPFDEQLGEAMYDKIRLSRGTYGPEQKAIVSRLRAQVGKAPGNAGLLTLLAEAELDLENYDAAIAAADRAISADPALARAYLWKGMAKLSLLEKEKSSDTAKWKEARSWIVKANRADSEDALALYEYYTSFMKEGRDFTPVAFDGLAKAVELLPQVDGFRISFAIALANKGDYESAKAVVRPLANSPHGGELATHAQKFMLAMDTAIKNGEKPQNIAEIWADPPKEEGAKGRDPKK